MVLNVTSSSEIDTQAASQGSYVCHWLSVASRTTHRFARTWDIHRRECAWASTSWLFRLHHKAGDLYCIVQVKTNWDWKDVHKADLYLEGVEKLWNGNATSEKYALFYTSIQHTKSLPGGLYGFVKSLRSLGCARQYNLTRWEPSRGYAPYQNVYGLELNYIAIEYSWRQLLCRPAVSSVVWYGGDCHKRVLDQPYRRGCGTTKPPRNCISVGSVTTC